MDEPSVPVSIDRNAMKLAINNLLDNAVKFSSSPTEIKVSLEKQQRHYHLNILDEGIGIPANEQLKIFDKFYHGKYASNYASTGTGLGLSIVKQIVKAHGGEVRVESEPGSGSTFIVLLPIETQSEA